MAKVPLYPDQPQPQNAVDVNHQGPSGDFANKDTLSINPEHQELANEWERKLTDANRVEHNWRSRGKQIQRLYRGNRGGAQAPKTILEHAYESNTAATFNILYANTETLFPALYQKPPQPACRSRYPGMKPVVDKAAEIMQKCLESTIKNQDFDEPARCAVKDFLLPGRGVTRIRWEPFFEEVPVMEQGPFDDMGMETEVEAFNEDGSPQTEQKKVGEEVYPEVVYWEDFIRDPTRNWQDCLWIGFRHLMTKEQLLTEFKDSPYMAKLIAEPHRIKELLRHTESSANRNEEGETGSMSRSNIGLGDVIQKALVWELWDKQTRKVVWYCPDAPSLVMRVDDDPYNLKNFYPMPNPLISVGSTDQQVPVPLYDTYRDLAEALDIASKRLIDNIRRVKARGAYNSAIESVKQILTADEGEMIGVDNVDFTEGLEKHIMFVDFEKEIKAIPALMNQIEWYKGAIYEVTGISDIMRGDTKASETATAQRIKGSMGTKRLANGKELVANYMRGILDIMGEIIVENFDDAEILLMAGVAPDDPIDMMLAQEAIPLLRQEYLRNIVVAVETDSTIVADATAEQEANQKVVASTGVILQAIPSLLQVGLPAPEVMMMSLKLLKVLFHSVPRSSEFIDEINSFTLKLEMMMGQQPMPGMMPQQPVPGEGPPGAGPNAPAPPGEAYPPTAPMPTNAPTLQAAE